MQRALRTARDMLHRDLSGGLFCGKTGRLAFYGSIADARTFFGCEDMEHIVKLINSQAEGGDGRAEEFIRKYREVQHV